MKVLSRDFTAKEKAFLLILALILIALAWYRFVFIPCRDGVAAANAERASYEDELMVVSAKEAQLQKMQEELDALGELKYASRMESYNNTKQELTLLNSILENANEYSISFSGVTKDGDQIRRNFSLSFKTGSFSAAKEIIDRLSRSEYRCLLGDLRYDISMRHLRDDETAPVVRELDGQRYAEDVGMSATATFFETMYGGTPDEGLPADKNA